MHGGGTPRPGIDQCAKPRVTLSQRYVENDPAIAGGAPRRGATVVRDNHPALNFPPRSARRTNDQLAVTDEVEMRGMHRADVERGLFTGFRHNLVPFCD
jgi:hypothetical protein